MNIQEDIHKVLEWHKVRDSRLVVHDIMAKLRDQYMPAFPLEVESEMDAVLMLVSESTGFRHDIIKSSSQEKEYVQARWLCYELLKRRGYSQVSIGKYFHRKQETVGHGIKGLKNDLKSDRELYFVRESVHKAYDEKWPVIVPNRFVGKYEQMFS